MKQYKTWIMSSVIELQADSKDEAMSVSMLYYTSNAPIAVYDCEEIWTLSFPYNTDEVDKILWWMWERLRESYRSIKKIK